MSSVSRNACLCALCLSRPHTVTHSANAGRTQKCEAFGVNASFAMPSFISEQEMTWWADSKTQRDEINPKAQVYLKRRGKCVIKEKNDYR